MNNSSFHRLARPVVLLSSVLLINTAFAQASNTHTIEEVIVSATKRDSSLQDTGIAISVMGAEDMKFRDLNNLDDMQNAIPGLSIANVHGTPNINIRGVGLNFYTGLGQPGVATHYDGIYLPRTGSTTTGMIDLAHVEVLRGPQGTLYGRNATGGSINFIAKKPDNEFGAGLSAGAGDYSRKFYEGYIDAPVTDRLALRAYGKHDENEGFGENEVDGKPVGDNDADMARFALLYEPLDTLEIYASYTRREDQGNYPFTTALKAGRTLGGYQIPDENFSFEPYNTKMIRQPMSKKRTEISNLTMTWDFGENYTLKSISGYVEHERDEITQGMAVDLFIADISHYELSKQWSQEFNLSGNWFEGRFNWLLGAYYSTEDGESPANAYVNVDNVSYPAGIPSGSTFIMNPAALTTDVNEGIFLDAYYSVLDSLRIVFGVRAGRVENELDQTLKIYITNDNADPGLLETLTSQFTAASGLAGETCDHEVNRMSTDSTDPKIGFEWDATDEIMVYAQYQTGFKGGGYDLTNSCNRSYDPEEVESVEIGMKASFLDGAMTLNSAIFHYDYTNYQVFKVEGLSSVIENAATAISQGAELELTYSPLKWLAIDAAYSYLDAHYDEYISKDSFLNTTFASGDAPEENLKGNKLNRSPENTLNVGLTFMHDINKLGLGMARLRLEGFYSDEYYMREFNRDIERQDSYMKYNAYLSVATIDERVSLQLFAKNITDETTLGGIFAIDTTYYYGGVYEAPRTVGGSVSVRF